jgi:chromosome segregation ATPase
MSIALALSLLKRFWWSIPLVVLLIALGITRHTLAGTKADLAACNKDRIVLTEKLRTTQTSLDGALAQINDNNARIEAANKALETNRQQAAADLARANARWEAAKSSVGALEASAKDHTQPPCKVSQRAAQALEGL